MLFKPRGTQPQKEEKPKNQMTIADMLAFRDTWTAIPCENFSVERILLKARLEKQRKAEVTKLVTSENGFRIRDKTEMDESEVELRRVQGSLNKLTDKNFDNVTRDMLSEELICNLFVLKGAVNIIFSKAVAEPVFSSLYARLCARIANYERDVVSEAAKRPELLARLEAAQKELTPPGSKAEGPRLGDFVRRVLITRCQAFYEQFVQQAIPESAEAEEHLRKQNMANIKFLGELYIKSMVTTVVIASVASYSLALGWESNITKTTVSDVDLEMTYNLFSVVGKKFDETAAAALSKSIWDPIAKYAEDKAFSMRIRCLLQNLLDLRKSGWKTKETAAPTSSNTEEGGADGQQQQQQQHSQRPMHRAASIQQQDGHGSGARRGGANILNNPMAGARRGERVTSFADLGQFGGGLGGNYALPPPPPPPPPPFNPEEPPPPFPGTVAPAVSDADKKLMALARPPPSLTEEVEKKILSIFRDAVTDGDWAAAAAALTEAVPGELKHTCVMCAAYTATKKVCMSSLEEDRETFSTALDNTTIFDVSSLARGYSWFLTDAVANNYKEDVPRVMSRLVQRIVGTKSMKFLEMIRDVMARSANYLDALYVPLEGEGCNWDEDFIEVWSSVLAEWVKSRGQEPEVKDAAKIVDCLATIKQRPFMRDIAPDFLMELSQHGLLPDDVIRAWVGTNGKEEKHKAFAEQLEQLFV